MINRLSIVVMILLFVTTTTYAETVLEGVIFDQPPWQFYDEEKETIVGIIPDVHAHIGKKIDVKFIHQRGNWSRAWEWLKTGDIDFSSSVSWKEKRAVHIHWAEPEMWTSKYVAWYSEDENGQPPDDISGSYQDLRDRSTGQIGITKKFSYSPDFWKYFPYQSGETSYLPENTKYHPKIQAANQISNGFLKLKYGRTTYFLAELTNGLFYKKKLDYKNLNHFEHILFSKDYFTVFSKKSKHENMAEIMEAFSRELQKMKDDGSYDAIVNKWID